MTPVLASFPKSKRFDRRIQGMMPWSLADQSGLAHIWPFRPGNARGALCHKRVNSLRTLRQVDADFATFTVFNG